MGGWGVPKSGRGIYMLDTWDPGIRTSKGFGPSRRVQHEAEEFQSATGCLFHTDGLYQNVSIAIFNVYICIRTSASIPSFHLQSNSHSTTPQATNIFNPSFDLPLTMQPSNSRSPLLTELLEDNARLRWRPFRSCRVLEKTGQSRVMWPIICCFVGETSVV